MRAMIMGLLLFAGEVKGADLEEKILQVSGSGSVQVKATVAEIRFSLEVDDKKSSSVESLLSERINRLTEVLKKEAPDKLNTSSFSIFPEYSNETPPEIRGYRGRGEVEIKIPIEKAGSAIAHAMEAGASGVSQVQLKASDKDLVAAKDQALTQAIKNALRTAQVAFSALNMELKEIEMVTISNSETPIAVPFRAAAFTAMGKNNGPQLEGEQTVQADVNLKLRFKSLN